MVCAVVTAARFKMSGLKSYVIFFYFIRNIFFANGGPLQKVNYSFMKSAKLIISLY